MARDAGVGRIELEQLGYCGVYFDHVAGREEVSARGREHDLGYILAAVT